MSEDGIHRKETPEVPIDAIREAVINSFAHARYDLPVQHEIDIFSNRISICNPGSFANEFEPIDFYTRDIRSYLRNEAIAKTLYLCKDVETFGSGIKKIYTLCNKAGVDVSYINEETAFTLEFSRKCLYVNAEAPQPFLRVSLPTFILALILLVSVSTPALLASFMSASF